MSAEALSEVLHRLVDAAFKGGTITDQDFTELHGLIDQPAAPEPAPAEPAAPATYATEGTGFNA